MSADAPGAVKETSDPVGSQAEPAPSRKGTEQPPMLGRANALEPVGRLAGLYGSFWIDETEFALGANSIQEVVNEPQEISALPLSPEYLIGLFNLRGTIIPIVDLRVFLSYPAFSKTEPRKVAIVQNGGLAIGLLFDSTGEVLSGKDAARTDFKKSQLDRKEVIIEGVLKFNDGKRLVQLLDPYEILNIDSVPRAPSAQTDTPSWNARGSRLNCLSFQLGHTTFALDLRFVQEVTEMLEVERALFSHGVVLGTANLRGITLPIIDFRGYVGKERNDSLDLKRLGNRKIIIMDTGNGLIGFMVFSIDSIVPYYESDLLPFAKIALPRSDIISGCLAHDEHGLVLLLDPQKLLSDPDFLKVASACKEVHDDKTDKPKGSGKERHLRQRRTFILFSVEAPFALDISFASEVINRPANILAPPYKLNFVEGVINLRGELITLINPRLLYGLPAKETDDQKILIFAVESQKYAIIVDSIDEIVMTTESHVLNTPNIELGSASQAISKDLDGCLSLPWRKSGGDTVMILNVESLVKSCLRETQSTAEKSTPAPTGSDQGALAGIGG
ncbi:MAG: chemotaxis protein CheW [Pseudomonadota bacterium]